MSLYGAQGMAADPKTPAKLDHWLKRTLTRMVASDRRVVGVDWEEFEGRTRVSVRTSE